MIYNDLNFIEIFEFNDLISRYGLRRNLPSLKKSSGTDMELYKGIVEGLIKDDDDAIERLYANRDASSRKKYQKTKNRLRKKLLNAMLFLNLRPGLSSQQTIIFVSLWKKLVALKVLIRLVGDRNALIEARRSLKTAQKYNLTQLSLEFALIIRSYYFKTGKVTLYKKYDLIATTLQNKHIAEQESVAAHQRFMIHYVRRLSYLEGSFEILKDSLSIVEKHLTRVESVEIRFIYHKLLIYYNDMQGKYEEVYNTAAEGIKYLNSIGKAVTKARYAEFYLQQLGSRIYVRDYDSGVEAYINCGKYTQEGNFTWFKVQEMAYIFFMHNKKYDTAREIFEITYGHKDFKLLDDAQKQRISILKYYDQFMNTHLDLNLHHQEKTAKELRSLIQSSAELQHDKQGYGFTIRLMYILLLVEQGKYDILTESIDSFKIYCARYFKSKYYPKSNAFLRLLLVLDLHSFSYLIIERKSKARYDRLLKTKLSYVEASENIQVVPYEYLWERIMNALKRDTDKVRKFNERKQRKVMATAPRLKRAAAVTDFSRTAA